MNFINDLTDMILDRTDSSPDWASAVATSLCSTAIGNDRWLVTTIGRVKLNTFFIMIGPSGIASKSVPINYFARPIIKRFDELMGYEPPQSTLFPSHFSLEGMIQYLSKEENIHEGLLMRDEFTNMFAEANKNYMGGIIEFLSELFDGHIGARYTRGTKLEKPQNVYASILAATTPYVYKVMSTDFFVQGTGNRILWVLWDKKIRKKKYASSHDFFGIHHEASKEKDIEKFANQMLTIRNSKCVRVYPDEDAGTMWMEQEEKWKDELAERFNENIYDLQQLYLVKIVQSALKLAGIHMYSRMVGPLAHIPVTELPITSEDMEWGLKRSKIHLAYFHELLEQWRTRPTQTEVRSLDEQVQYVADRILDTPQGIKWADLRQNVKWEKRTWFEVLSQLYDSNQIVGIRHVPTIGRPGYKFYSADGYPKKLKPIPWDQLQYQLKLR